MRLKTQMLRELPSASISGSDTPIYLILLVPLSSISQSNPTPQSFRKANQ